MGINLNYRLLHRLGIDLKVMSRLNKSHKYILCIIDEVTNYLITVPMHQSKSEQIGDALIESIIAKYCVPEYIIKDQDSAYMPSLMNIFIQETRYQNKNSGILHSSIITSRTWN